MSKKGVFSALLCAGVVVVLAMGVGANAASSGAEVHRHSRSGGNNYDYVHAHLDRSYLGCYTPSYGPAEGWARPSVPEGFCPGKFLDGEAPFNQIAGWSFWKYVNRAELPPRLDGLPLVGGRAIEVIQAVRKAGDLYRPTPSDEGGRIVCYISDRSHGDCYTDYERQKDQAPGTKGGPLSLNAHEGSTTGDQFIFVRGWCAHDDPLCTPHG